MLIPAAALDKYCCGGPRCGQHRDFETRRLLLYLSDIMDEVVFRDTVRRVAIAKRFLESDRSQQEADSAGIRTVGSGPPLAADECDRAGADVVDLVCRVMATSRLRPLTTIAFPPSWVKTADSTDTRSESSSSTAPDLWNTQVRAQERFSSLQERRRRVTKFDA